MQIPETTHNNESEHLSGLLLEVNTAIITDVGSSDLLKLLESVLYNRLKIGKAALISVQTEEGVLFSFGISESVLTSLNFQDIIDSTEIKINPDFKGKNYSARILVPLFYGNKILAHLMLDNVPDHLTSNQHLKFLQVVASLLMTAIENKKWYQEFKKKTEFNKELELASHLQHMLFPELLPNDQRFQASAYFRPQQHLSGDYYDFIQTGENEFVFCMADVSGKGVPAALLMSNFQASWRTLLGYCPDLMDLVRELNNKVNLTSRGEKFITCFIGKYNTETRILTYVNAGHTAPVLFGGENPLLLNVGCSGLGMLEQLKGIKQGYLTIPRDSFLLCYTDGLVELENEKGDQFGVERLIELIKKIKKETPESINDKILRALKIHGGNEKFSDDIALLSCKLP